MPENETEMTEAEAAEKIGRGCHKPQEVENPPQYLESFKSMIGKLARNCRYTISEEKVKAFNPEEH